VSEDKKNWFDLAEEELEIDKEKANQKLQEIMAEWRQLEPQSSNDILSFIRNHIQLIQEYEGEKQVIAQDLLVQRYEFLNDILDKYHKLMSSVEQHYQEALHEECEHDLWYLLYYESDDYEGRTYWTCKCLQCGLTEERRPRHFQGKVIMGESFCARAKRNEKPYNVIREEYHSLLEKYEDYNKNKDAEGNQKIPAKVLTKRYKKQNANKN